MDLQSEFQPLLNLLWLTDFTVIWPIAIHTLVEPVMVKKAMTGITIMNMRTIYEEEPQEEEVVDTEDINLLHIHSLIISIPITIRLGPLLQNI